MRRSAIVAWVQRGVDLSIMEETNGGTSVAPEDPTDGTGLPPQKRRAFRGVKRDLSEEGLSNPDVNRLLLDDIERLEGEVRELGEFRSRFHDAQSRANVLAQIVQRTMGL